MADQESIDRFLDTLRASGLLPEDRVSNILAELLEAGVVPTDAASLVAELVRREILTAWQAENLLKGKHKGFLLGPYVLLQPLGQGAMGQVYLAQHTMMHRRCAIKILAKKYQKDPDLLARFQVEARAIAALDHPHIVRAYDFNRDTINGSELYYLVMEYVEGQDLQRLVERSGPLEYVRAADFMRQAAVGLAHAHEAGFIHRDIKPGNLLVDTKGVLKILDLGLARLTRGATQVVETGTSVSGTPDYIAPEQILNRPDIDGRADIYSLGLTFYFLLVGQRPYVRKTMPEILAAHCKEPLEPIDTARPDIPYDLISIIDQMTAKQPDRRFRTAEDVASALQTWLQNESCGQSSRLAAFKTAALRSRHRGVGESSDVKLPPTTGADLELAPLDERPSPSTVSMQSPGAGTHRSTLGEKTAANATAKPAEPGAKPAQSVKAVVVDLPPAPSAEEEAASLPAVGLLADLPLSPDLAAGPQLAPRPRRKPTWQQRVVEVVSESPWFWAILGWMVFVMIVVLLWLLIGLLFPGSGIERSEQPSSVSVVAPDGGVDAGWDKA